MKIVDYSSTSVPSDYKCRGCGATNCKLWRENGGFPCGDILLECVDCAVKSQNNPKVTSAFVKSAAQPGFAVAEDGMYTDHYGSRTDQIGWRAPAVPTEDNSGYWGYTSVPQAGCDWWTRLPLRMKR